MSLIVHNAYRYPLDRQNEVHRAVMANCETVTTRLVDDAVRATLPRLEGHGLDTWFGVLSELMHPEMPRDLALRGVAHYRDADKPEQFVRAFLHQYHRYTAAYPSTNPVFDTVITWTYVWDDKHGYLCLFLPLGVRDDELVSGIGSFIEPYGYDGRTGETWHPSESPETVASAWERLVGMGSVGHAGATASLCGYELSKVFGLV